MKLAVLVFGCDVNEGRLWMNSVMMEDLTHAFAGLEEDGEVGLVLDGQLKAFEGVASAIHAGEEVEDDVMDGRRISRKRQGLSGRRS